MKMTRFEIDFIIIAGYDASSRIHSTKGWARSSLPRDLKVVVRENTNIQDEIEIIAFRAI